MNKVNFDGLKNIKAPQEWLEKASVIAKTPAKPRYTLPFYRAAAAVGIVLVTSIGLTSYLLFGTLKAPLELSDGNMSTEGTVGVTEASDTPENDPAMPGVVQAPTTAESENATDKGGQSRRLSAAQPTEKDGALIFGATGHPGDSAAPTQRRRRRSQNTPHPTTASGSGSRRPTESGAHTPPHETVGEALPHRTDPTQISPRPTQSETQPQRSADPTTGTETPAVRPSAPTEDPAPTAAQSAEPPAFPTTPRPTVPAPTQKTTEPSAQPETHEQAETPLVAEDAFSFSATFDASLLNEGEIVYCIYAPEAYATGTYASVEKKKADYYITKKGTVYAYCDVLIDLPEGNVTFRYTFVSESGKVLARGTQVV